VVFVGLTPYKRAQRKIFGSKGDKVAEQWRRLHNEKLYYLHSSYNIIRVTKILRWAGHVAPMKEEVLIGFW
jgi:hypothetical protein